MHKTLNPKTHGYIDYIVVAMFFLAPSLFNFSDTASNLSYALAVIHLIVSLSTAYPLGLLKAIPFTVHGAMELMISVIVAISPWVFGFEDDTAARNFYVASGIAFFLVWSLTDYKGAGAPTGRMAFHGLSR
jgi:hypothetical protein